MSDEGEWETVKGKGKSDSRSSGKVAGAGLASFRRPGQSGSRDGGAPGRAGAPGIGIANWATKRGSGTSHSSRGGYTGGGPGRGGAVGGGPARDRAVGGGSSGVNFAQRGNYRLTR